MFDQCSIAFFRIARLSPCERAVSSSSMHSEEELVTMSAAPLLNKDCEGEARHAPRDQAMTSSQPSFACEIVSAPCICRD